MAALLRCHVVILKKTQLVSGRRKSDYQVSSFAGGTDDGVVHYERCMNRAVKKAVLSSKVERHSKVEPVMTFRDQVPVCVPASATLEQVFARGGAALEHVSGVAFQQLELTPAGDSATSSKCPCLESQWMAFSNAKVERDLSELELDDQGEREAEVSEEQNSVVASRTQVTEKKAINPTKAEACLYRLELRRKELSIISIRAFANFPHQKAYRKGDYEATYLTDVSKMDNLTAAEEIMLLKMIKIVHLTTTQRKKLERPVGHALTYHRRPDVFPMKVAKLDAKLHEFELTKVRTVMGNLRPSRSVANEYNCGGLEVTKLIQVWKFEKFDLIRVYKMSPYSHWWILQGLTRAIANDSRTLGLPVHVRESLRSNIRASARMLQDGDPTTFDFTGEPSIPCDSCKGRGWLVCDFCEGQKVNVQTKKNRIYRRCPSCRAAGVVICSRCKVFKCVSFPDDRDAAL